jgi:hypothetical protein
MAFGTNGTIPGGFKAAADLSAKQFYCVEITAADTVNVCNAATDPTIGILQNKPVADEACEIAGAPGSIGKGICAGAITVGQWVGTDANGKLEAKTTDKDFALGQALEAGAADRIIAVLFRPCFIAV